ncbi:MAG: hypothetical protein ACJ780_24745 [Solirubrobacteraceae bacterium]
MKILEAYDLTGRSVRQQRWWVRYKTISYCVRLRGLADQAIGWLVDGGYVTWWVDPVEIRKRRPLGAPVTVFDYRRQPLSAVEVEAMTQKVDADVRERARAAKSAWMRRSTVPLTRVCALSASQTKHRRNSISNNPNSSGSFSSNEPAMEIVRDPGSPVVSNHWMSPGGAGVVWNPVSLGPVSWEKAKES